MQSIYILHAINTKYDEHFIELFTTIENLNLFLSNHPHIIKDQITWHEIDPK
jgi:glutathionyl-hydroquinone reductase